MNNNQLSNRSTSNGPRITWIFLDTVAHSSLPNNPKEDIAIWWGVCTDHSKTLSDSRLYEVLSPLDRPYPTLDYSNTPLSGHLIDHLIHRSIIQFISFTFDSLNCPPSARLFESSALRGTVWIPHMKLVIWWSAYSSIWSVNRIFLPSARLFDYSHPP